MLDSFKSEESSSTQTEKQEKFDAPKHLQSLCEGGKIVLGRFMDIKYQQGWGNILEKLIASIKCYPIELQLVASEYGHLDIIFQLYQKTQEVRVWRAIDTARRESKHTCMECGERGNWQFRDEKITVICSDCLKKAESNGETGTWLDRY